MSWYPKVSGEAGSFHENFAGRVTAGSDAASGDIDLASRHGYLLDQNWAGGLCDSLDQRNGIAP